MKLHEVATTSVKCGMIFAAGTDSVNADDWHGATEVFTNKPAFIKAIKAYFTEHVRALSDEDDDSAIAGIKAAKTMGDLSEIEGWDEFIEHVWIDDRF